VALVSSPHATALSVLRLAPEREYEEDYEDAGLQQPGDREEGLKIAEAIANSSTSVNSEN